MKNFLIAAFVLFQFVFAVSAETFNARVCKIIDGDTIEVLITDMKHPKYVKIRLYGIDAPENDQFGGISSCQNLAGILMSNPNDVDFVTTKTKESNYPYSEVKIDVIKKDKYGRSIAKLYKNNVYINKIMLERGQAWIDERYVKRNEDDNDLRDAEKIGSKKRISLCPPWEFRRMKKEEKNAFEVRSMLTRFNNGVEISVSTQPYMISVIQDNDFKIIMLDGFDVIDEDYPYQEEIVLKTKEILDKMKGFSENKYSSIEAIFFSTDNEKSYVGDIELTSIFNGNKMNSYLFQWLADAGYLDRYLIEKMCRNIEGNNLINQYITRSKGKGLNAKKVPITPFAWHNMSNDMKRYLIKQIYELTSSEIDNSKNTIQESKVFKFY